MTNVDRRRKPYLTPSSTESTRCFLTLIYGALHCHVMKISEEYKEGEFLTAAGLQAPDSAISPPDSCLTADSVSTTVPDLVAMIALRVNGHGIVRLVAEILAVSGSGPAFGNWRFVGRTSIQGTSPRL